MGKETKTAFQKKATGLLRLGSMLLMLTAFPGCQAQQQLVITSSHTKLVKKIADGTIVTHGNEVDSIILPAVVVKGIHAKSVKKGMCTADGDTFNCLCHASDMVKLPSVTIEHGGRTLELEPKDYLGEPFLVDYQVMCPSKLVAPADSQEPDQVSMSKRLHEQLEKKKPKRKRTSFLLGSNLPANSNTPEENLKEQEIFMGVIGIFLITIYTLLVIKKKYRLSKERATKEAAEQAKEQANATENNSEDALANLLNNDDDADSRGPRDSSKSTLSKKDKVSQQLGDDIQKDAVARQSTGGGVNRIDSMNVFAKGYQGPARGSVKKNKKPITSINDAPDKETGGEYISTSIQEEESVESVKLDDQ